MKRLFIVFLILIMSFASSCASGPQESQTQTQGLPAVGSTAASSVPASTAATPSTTASPQTTVKPTVPPTTAKPVVDTGFYSPLTGLPIEKELVGKRPVAVMVNNIKASMPQVGISKADVVYEALAEGGITRLMCLFLDYENVGTIGSVRSARDYYLDFAQIHDAIFIHAGGSDLAYSQIKSRGINTLDGVKTTVSGVFWRDSDRLQTMSKEHTMVTSGEKLAYGIAKRKYRTDLKSGFSASLQFEQTPSGFTGSGTYIKIPNSNSYVSELSYDQNSKLYFKKQFGKAHIDGATGQQLSFTNVLVLYTKQKTIDDYGRLGIDLTGSGKGYYLYGGQMMPIQWSRSDRDGGIKLLKEDGSLLKLAPGKSYISVSSDKIYKSTTIQ